MVSNVNSSFTSILKQKRYWKNNFIFFFDFQFTYDKKLLYALQIKEKLHKNNNFNKGINWVLHEPIKHCKIEIQGELLEA